MLSSIATNGHEHARAKNVREAEYTARTSSVREPV